MGKRHTTEERTGILAKFDGLVVGGKSTEDAATELGVAYSTIAAWKKKPANGNGSGGKTDAETIKELRAECARLRKLAMDALMGQIKLVRRGVEE